MDYEFETASGRIDANVLFVTISNPPCNVMSMQMLADLTELGSRAAGDPDVRVIVLQSDDPEFFVVHFDANAVVGLPDDTAPVYSPDPSFFHQMVIRFRDNPKPSLVKIAGRAGGGGAELASSCDMRFGVIGKTILNQMEVPLGIIPGGSGCVNAQRLVGRGRALEMLIGADDIDAATAERWGWLNRAFATTEDMDRFVDRLARRIATFPPHAVALAKQAVNASDPDWRANLATEDYLVRQALASPHARPLLQTFLDLGAQTREQEVRVGELAQEAVLNYFGENKGAI